MVAATGVLAGRPRRALDSTVLDDAVAAQDTVTQLVAAVRPVIREVPGAGGGGTWCTAHDYADPGKPKIAWDDEAARAALVDALVTDALNLLATCPNKNSVSRPPTRSGCWRWSPGRTWNRPGVRTARTGGGGSPSEPPATG